MVGERARDERLADPVGPTIITWWWFATQGEPAKESSVVLSSPLAALKSRLFDSLVVMATAPSIGALEQFSLDEQSESVLEGELVVVGVLALLEQSRRHGR